MVYDVNTAAHVDLLFRDRARLAIERMLTPPPRAYRVVVVGNATPGRAAAAERVTEAGATDETVRALGVDYPVDVYSMSHIAVPFPPHDGLYGSHPDPDDDFGISLGTIATRGETGMLVVGLDTLLRNSSNPFYGAMAAKIEDGIAPR